VDGVGLGYKILRRTYTPPRYDGRLMETRPLPIERLYLSAEISEPALGASANDVFYVRRADARRTIVRQSLKTGLAETVAAEPRPMGGIGYGGGVYTVRDQTLIYAGNDGRLHLVDLTTGAQNAVTPAYEGVAAPSLSPCGRFVAFLAEQDGCCNVLLADRSGASLPVKLTNDPWYAFNPVFSPDGSRMAWQEWSRLDMPWDEARLHIVKLATPAGSAARLADLLPVTPVTILGKTRVSFAAPQWSPDGQRLAFTSDESGWRSLYLAGPDGENPAHVETGEGEIGLADWLPARYGYRWNAAGTTIYAVRSRHSRDTLLRISVPLRDVVELPSAYTDVVGLQIQGDSLVYVGSTALEAPSLVTRDANGEETSRATNAVGLTDLASLSTPEVISWRTKGGAISWGIFYPAVGGTSDRPRPLLVHMHGGPTSQVPLTWMAQAQYFATRGWHYLIVNHRGGTGYGRAYQNQLRGRWGVVDLEDGKTGAEHILATRGADPKRVAITGGSAGGYATLWALTQQSDFWAAGVALFPLAHIYNAVLGAHRFERHYEETLMGPLPEAGPVWKDRSPIVHVDKVRAPVLLFHGTEDKAVPCQESIDFAEAVRRRGGVAELVTYEGEGHGFAKEANRRDMILRMERFLDKYVICLQR